MRYIRKQSVTLYILHNLRSQTNPVHHPYFVFSVQGVFAGFAFAFIFTTFIVHVYTFVNESKWTESFEDYIL